MVIAVVAVIRRPLTAGCARWRRLGGDGRSRPADGDAKERDQDRRAFPHGFSPQPICDLRCAMCDLAITNHESRITNVNWFRLFVTVNVPSACADTLIQYAGPLCAGGGGALGPGWGAGIGATGIAAGWSSTVLAMNMPGGVYSCPLSREK